MKKGNEKIEGTMVSEDTEWLKIDTGKKRVSIRKSDVDRFEETPAKESELTKDERFKKIFAS